jgi:GNAT superfamily N-acetyltransferase
MTSRPPHHHEIHRVINGVSFRTALDADAAAIEDLMKASARELSRSFYDERQIPSVERFIATLDPMLLEDGTYFVGEAPRAAETAVPARLVACGGWSRRDKLFTGIGEKAGGARLLDPAVEPARVRAMFVHPDFARRGLGRAILDLCEDAARAEGFRRLALVATLPGEPLYAACGFVVIERTTIALPDGVQVDLARMEKPILTRS